MDDKQLITDHKILLEVYKLIQLNVSNPKYTNGSIANEIVNNSVDNTEDLINELFVIFMKRKHEPIEFIKAYVKQFCYGELMNIKRYNQNQDELKENFSISGWGKPKK